MEHEATINARMPMALKRGGTRVLEENNVSPTQIIRRLYQYMDHEGCIPACLEESTSSGTKLFDRRRELARSVAGTIHLPGELDIKAERAGRIEAKYSGLL